MKSTAVIPDWLDISPILADGLPVVALESSVIAQGLPWPANLETALAAEQAVRAAGAIPATIAVLHGRIKVGLTAGEIEELAQARGVLKAGRRDLATAVAQRRTAATTVSATLFLAHQAGIRVFATGGIGGVHRMPVHDVSADLMELTRAPVAVVCAGAKSILDLPRTLETLESLGVPVIGYRSDDFPAFYLRSSGLPVSARVDSPSEAVQLLAAHWRLGGGGALLAQPVAAELALDPIQFENHLQQAEVDAREQGIAGKALTPFLLARLTALTHGQTLRANQALIVANARLAAEVAVMASGG